MADLISKNRAKHFACEFCNEHCGDEPCEPSDCEWMAAIDTEPGVEIVRCKDCIKSHKSERDSKLNISWCDKWHNIMRDNDFCSYGERRVE